MQWVGHIVNGGGHASQRFDLKGQRLLCPLPTISGSEETDEPTNRAKYLKHLIYDVTIKAKRRV